ncbi:MAG TPA: DNA repair protein RadC [Bacilli bacterium]|nr:DNA repair protein RadC [Bacilli bacterium]
MLINNLPIKEQPRERLKEYGVDSLSNSDLLSIILRTGIKGLSVKDISNNVLNEIGHLDNLNNFSLDELANIKGVGLVKAMSLLASIELGKRVTSIEPHVNMYFGNYDLLHQTFKQFFFGLKQEKFMAIYLDSHKCLISYKIIYIGTIDRAYIHPRDIFREAIKVSGSFIIVIHNHPTGDLTASKADIQTTEKLISVGNIIDIPLLNHLITNGVNYNLIIK